jgi:hypothetical protein
MNPTIANYKPLISTEILGQFVMGIGRDKRRSGDNLALVHLQLGHMNITLSKLRLRGCFVKLEVIAMNGMSLYLTQLSAVIFCLMGEPKKTSVFFPFDTYRTTAGKKPPYSF